LWALAGWALGASIAGAAPVARAQENETITAPQPQPVVLQGDASLDARWMWFPRMPTMTATFPSSDFAGTRYENVTGDLPSTGHGQLLAFGADVGIAIDRHWTLPLVGIVIGGAVGGYPAVATSVDGVPFTLKPWTTGYVYMQAIGVGYRARARRWAFETGLRFGVSVAWMKTKIAIGGDEYDASMMGISAALKGDVALCRRLDPTQRACLFFAPSIYEFGFMNGGSLGLRWEVGQ
jgi:hypothetical protein